jgi:3'(2'), 5'-bisphosphate nucleotidase
MRIDLGEELETMLVIAREASEYVRDWLARGQSLDAQQKESGEPVTALDHALNTQIRARIEERLGGDVVAEEDDASQRAAYLDMGRIYYVDPIDGTAELLAGNGEFAVMIGLAIDGRAEAGVVALPAEGCILAGRVACRAVIEQAGGERGLLGVSSCASFAEARVVVSRSHRPAVVDSLRRRLGLGQVIPCGSAGVKVARIARGEAELYVHAGHGLAPWDCCAPEAVLAAAGGRMSTLEGAPLRYRPQQVKLTGGVVASNGVLHAGALSAVPWAVREEKRLREQSGESS